MENQKISIEELVQSEGWKKFMEKLDLMSIVLLSVVTILTAAGLSATHYYNLILTVTLLTLANTSFFMSFQKFESGSKILSALFYKIYGIGLSLGFISILFKVMHWPLSFMFSVASTLMITVSLYLGVLEKTAENKNALDWKFFVRIILALVPLIYLMIEKMQHA